MIDFPTLFPNLVKYIPNWMERFYPRIAQFARGEGYPCGNKGVFIPRRNNCWTHPKTGNRLTKPLTYQKYQEAKEKSQKSRTEKGRTALQDREQGFRDKAREKVKGWQNKNVETEVKQTPKKGEEFLKKLSSSDYYRDHSGIKEIARAIDENDGIVDTGLSKSGKASIAPGGGIMSGKVEILKLEEPNTARPWGTAVIKIDGKEQKVNLSNLANGVRYQLNKASQKQDIPVEKKQRVTGRTMALSRQKELEKTSEGQTLLEAEKDFEKTVKGTRLLNERKFDEAATAKNKALVNHNAKQAYDLPDQDQKDYDAKQPAEINLSSGLGMMEGWRSKGFEKYLNTPYDKRSLAPWDSRTTGIPWSVKVIGREDPRIIAGAKVRDVDQKTRVVELYDTEGLTFLSHFRSGDRVKSDRARRLVKEIAEGKSRDVDLNDIHILIENGEDGFKKSTEGKQKAVEDERRQEKDWDDFLSSENYSKDDYEKLDKWKKLSAVYRFEKIQKSKKQPKKNDFNSNLALTNFGNTNMRRRKSKQGISEFAKGDGYPCGNNGVFIPRRNKCWKHPKTGQRMRKPLTYQNYQDAKEKSQRSRTESGKTALANREQSFRDKAREKVKGWQNKTPESAESKRAVADIERIKSGQHVINKRDGYSLAYRGRGVYDLNDLDVPKGWRAKPTKLTEKEATDFLAEKYKSMNLSAPKSNPKSEPKQTPNSTGVKGAGGKPETPTATTQKQSTGKISEPKITKINVNKYYNDNPIKDYETFKKEIPKELARVNFEYNSDGLIPVSTVRRELKDRVDKKDFDKWMIDLQGEDDDVLLAAGENSERSPDAIKTAFGKPRDYIQYTNQDVLKKGKTEIKRYKGQITDVKEFKTQLDSVYDDLNNEAKNKGFSENQIPVYELRRKLGDKVSRGDFNNLINKIQQEEGYRLSGGEMRGITPDKRVDSVMLPSGGFRYYLEREETQKRTKKQPKKNDFNSNLKLAQFGGNNLRRRKSKLANFASYPCGNKGVFIPSSKNCYTHPKTGAKLDKPLKFKDYTQARKEAFQKSKAGGELTETEQQLVQDVNRLQGKVSDKRRAKELNNAAKRMGAKAILPSGIAEADPSKIKVDPKRFQYKIIGEQTKSGEVGSLSGVKKWDSNLGGILQVWRDPRDGEVFVVNGHNRLALAKKLNAPSVTVKLIDAKSPQEARAIGALTNIAEGRGNAQDAAKFFRDSGVTKQELEKKGVPMREKIAEDGLALSNLSDSLFNRVVQGQIPEQRAVVIGSKIKDHRQQQDLLELVEKEEKRGKKITNDTIEELSDMVTNAPSKTESQGGLFDLLGFSPESRSLAVEKAQIQSAIKRQLSGDKRLFSTVGKSKAAQNLEKAGNKINVEESNEIADTAGKALSAFDQEKMLTGKVSDYLNQAAERLAGNQKGRDKIIKETYEQVLDELQKTYRFGKGASSKGTDGLSAIDREEKAIQDEKRKQYEKAKKAGNLELFTASANLRLAKFGKAGCCCEASKPLRRRKTKLTPRLKRRGNRYA